MVGIYALLGFWTLFSIYYIFRIRRLGKYKVNLYIFDSIPGVFTTIGVLGTFVGIYFGLQKFQVEDITGSIPTLLEGLKTAFSTSIWGIVLSLIFGRITHLIQRIVEKNEPEKPTDELAALLEINQTIKEGQKVQNETLENNLKVSESGFKEIKSALVGENDSSVSTQILKLRNQSFDLQKDIKEQTKAVIKVQKALGGDDETSLLTQLMNLRAEQKEAAVEMRGNVKFIVTTMESNSKLLSNKFDEFAELLAKNNTEALVDVMKEATEQFNSQMSALIEKLVKENFDELNKSVERMNTWQQENKEMITQLTNQFKAVANDFNTTSTSIKDIVGNTQKLTNENSHLSKLIIELQKVMIDDTKYQEIVGKLVSTVDTIKSNTEAFDNTTEKLNKWVRNQMDFRDSVAKLLSRLEEIDKIKDINDVFWNDTKKGLNESVSIIKKANQSLSDDLEDINESFYTRLNDTLQNLDTLIQRIIQNNR